MVVFLRPNLYISKGQKLSTLAAVKQEDTGLSFSHLTEIRVFHQRL